MIKIAIVEDEQIYIDQLSGYMDRFRKETGNEIETTIFRDGDEIAENYKAGFDIILMDIQMQFMDGMTAAEKIRELDSEVIIMFITNMTQYAIRGYEVDALDYMVKPVEYFSFSQKLLRAISKLHRSDGHYITVPVESGVKKLKAEDIYYLESFGHRIVYKTKDGEFDSRGTMKDLEEALEPCGFYRSAKSYLVNMKYVDGVKKGCCIINGEELQVSRQKRKEFMEALLAYMSGEQL
ncbi:LytR/AlgR family response regulator transcription factor [Lachnospiraceae bacterium C1.1]|nr:LytTR family DNA-binding domain-containing protein [Lachnospiraceae bacterium C1.1]